MLPPRPLTAGEAQALRQRVIEQLDAVKQGKENSSLQKDDLNTIINIMDWFQTSAVTPAPPQTDSDTTTSPTPKPTLQNILEVVLRTEKKLDTEKNQGSYAAAARRGNTSPPTETPPAKQEPIRQRLQCELKSLVVQIKDLAEATGIRRVARTELLG